MTAEEATAESAAATTAGTIVDALTRIGYQNPVAPLCPFCHRHHAKAQCPPCPCAQNAL